MVRRLPAAATVAAALLLAGCDGYPTEDEPLLDLLRLEAAERVEALNELGTRAAGRGRWQYRMEGDCAMLVTHKLSWWSWERSVAELRTAAVDIVSRNSEGGREYVVVVEAGAHDLDVFVSRRLFDAQMIEHLLQLKIRDCRRSGGLAR
jgi:hypothetical protein